MAKGDDTLHRLRWAAERACGSMRDVAWELEAIGDQLPKWRSTAQRQQLMLAVDRLKSTSDLLTAEVNASSPRTAGLVAKVGRGALVAAIAITGSLVGGAGEGIGQEAFDRVVEKQQQALKCLDEVQVQSADAVAAMGADIDQRLDDLARSFKHFAMTSKFARHPAFIGVAESEHVLDTSLTRMQRMNYLSEVAQRLAGFSGPAEWYEGDEEESLLRQDIAELDRLWRHLTELHDQAIAIEDPG